MEYASAISILRETPLFANGAAARIMTGGPTFNLFSRSFFMSNSTQPIPTGHENLIPHLVCSPCAEAIEFYKKAFGAEEVHRMPAPDGRRIMHAAIRIGKSFVFLVDDFPEFCGGQSSTATALKGTPVSIHHYVENCDAAIKRALD